MDEATFRESLKDEDPPTGIGLALEALWRQAQGEWDAAHELCNREGGVNGSWVHAYLHRVEGDLSNADYWYRRAGKQRPRVSLDEEWAAVVRALLD